MGKCTSMISTIIKIHQADSGQSPTGHMSSMCCPGRPSMGRSTRLLELCFHINRSTALRLRWVGTPKPSRVACSQQRGGMAHKRDGKGAEKQPLVCPTTDTWLMADHEALDVNGTFAPKGNNGQKPSTPSIYVRSFVPRSALGNMAREIWAAPPACPWCLTR
ncbi:hypothetical protein BC826DRAFT_84641 [Russula brevipes]|nr:hypothetical protein BC826DRAFT_84641 [Russula brevipes]